MPNLVDVPENAVREEPLAFGLTAPQLLVCGIAVGIGAVVQLLPIWLPLQIFLTVLLAGPVLLAAILPIRGEPAYRWVIRYVRYRRGPRTWFVSADQVPHKWQISDEAQDQLPASGADAQGDTAPDRLGNHRERAEDALESAPGARELPMTGDRIARLRIVDPADDHGSGQEAADLAGESHDRPAAIPHVLPTMRVVAVAGFAGGVGRTTIAAEIATLVGSHARIRGLDGAESAVRVLVLDAARLSSAMGLRLGLSPAALAGARSHRFWREPGAAADFAVHTKWGADVLTLPPHPQLAEREGLGAEPGLGAFGAAEAGELVDGAQRAGYHLLVVDLGSLLEEGHRELIDQADLVLGIVRPTLESLPDVFRLATVMRAQGMGRKLMLVASGADDDTEIRRLAREADVPVAGCIRADSAFTAAADRGEPAWASAPDLWNDLAPIARAAWPLLPDGRRVARRRSVLAAVRSTIPAPGGSR
jgi:CO dehydrogenase nickel-insertion accessory protein CooC1